MTVKNGRFRGFRLVCVASSALCHPFPWADLGLRPRLVCVGLSALCRVVGPRREPRAGGSRGGGPRKTTACRVRMTTWVNEDVGRNRARTASRGAELSRWTRGKADVVYVADAFEVMTRQTLC